MQKHANKRIYSTVAKYDLLPSDNLKASIDFLDFSKADVSKATGQAKNSIRYDERVPAELEERIKQIANIINLVAEFFEGNPDKTKLWFVTENPMLGNISPRDMIRFGRYEKLRKFIINARNDTRP